MTGKRVLVTGATGFVGGAVTRALTRAGHQVTALVRDAGRAADLTASGVSVRTGDMLRPETYAPLVAEADAVVHAAQLRPGRRPAAGRLAKMRHADQVMTAALGDACRRSGARLLYTSGAYVYGDHGDRWITESTPHNPAPLGAMHAAGAAVVREQAADGLDAVVVHCGFAYGPGGNFKTAFLDQPRTGALRHVGGGGNYWSCIHLDDLAAGYVAALEHAAPGSSYNLADDEPLPLADFTARVAHLIGVRRTGAIPKPLAAAALGGPVANSLTVSYRVSNRRAKDELGWSPAYPSTADGLPGVLAQLGAARPPDAAG